MTFISAHDANALSKKARQNYARTVFKFETIAEMIKQATSVGQNEIRIFQTLAVDLEDTPAANKLIKKLKALGYEISWEQAAQPEMFQKRATSRFTQYRELVIRWCY